MRPERSLTACLNGSRRADEHPAVPLTAPALARAARGAVAAGATDVHVHPRDVYGRESLAAEDVGTCVAAIRAAVPGVRVGVTSLAPAGTDRESLVRSWVVLPDAASVNWHEPGAEPLAHCLLDRGVDVEAGLWQPASARAFLASGLAGACARVLVEPMEPSLGEALANAEQVLELVRPTGRPTQLHGDGRTAWPVLARAAELGLQLRIGLEDVLVDPGGEVVADNEALVAAALELGGWRGVPASRGARCGSGDLPAEARGLDRHI